MVPNWNHTLTRPAGCWLHLSISPKIPAKIPTSYSFTTYYGLINSILASWRRKLRSTDSPNLNQISSLDSPNKNITTRSAYAAILDHFFQPPTSETKILRYGFPTERLTNVYMMPFLIIQEVKLQMFQLKIIHNILTTRRSLFRARLIPTVGHVRTGNPSTHAHALPINQ